MWFDQRWFCEQEERSEQVQQDLCFLLAAESFGCNGRLRSDQYAITEIGRKIIFANNIKDYIPVEIWDTQNASQVQT